MGGDNEHEDSRPEGCPMSTYGTVTIEIPETLALEIVASFGVWIGKTRSQEHREKIARKADEFIRSLPENRQDDGRYLLQDTITRWTPAPNFGPAPVSTELAAHSGHAVDAPLATLIPEAKHELTKTSLGAWR